MFGFLQRKATVSKTTRKPTQKPAKTAQASKTGSTPKTAQTPRKRANKGSQKAKTLTIKEKQAVLDSARIRASKTKLGRRAVHSGEPVAAAPRNTTGFRMTPEAFKEAKKLLDSGLYSRLQVCKMTGISRTTIRRIASVNTLTEYRTLSALENESYGDNGSKLKISAKRTSELSQYKRRPKSLQTNNKQTTKTSQKRATKKSLGGAGEDVDKEATLKLRPEGRMSSGTARTIAKMNLLDMTKYILDEAQKEQKLTDSKAIIKHNEEVLKKTYDLATEFCKNYRTYQTLQDWESQKNISY